MNRHWHDAHLEAEWLKGRVERHKAALNVALDLAQRPHDTWNHEDAEAFEGARMVLNDEDLA